MMKSNTLNNLDKPNRSDESDKIVENVISKFRYRSNVGIKKYGTTLQDSKQSESEFRNHLQEELMDGILYLEKLISFNNLNKESLVKWVNDLDVPPKEMCIGYSLEYNSCFYGRFDFNWNFTTESGNTFKVDKYIDLGIIKELFYVKST